MDCEKEQCDFCNKVMVMGKQKIMDNCLHIVCADCHQSRRAEVCPRCANKRSGEQWHKTHKEVRQCMTANK